MPNPDSKEFIDAAQSAPDQAFAKWIKYYSVKYNSNEERTARYNIWLETLQFVAESNAKSTLYQLGLNKFADKSPEEVLRQYKSGAVRASRTTPTQASTTIPSILTSRDTLPVSVDWRVRNAVTPVKSQGKCGGCWAFSSAATVESLYAMGTGKQVDLSEQELVDCVPDGDGCNGDSLNEAFDTIVARGGVFSEIDYPYISEKSGLPGTCRATTAREEGRNSTTIDDYFWLRDVKEEMVQAAVAQQPVAVVIDARARSFDLYKGGIYDAPCGNASSHAVTIVGYGVDNGIAYWLVKNSWGTDWGENGYMRLIRGSSASGPYGHCGIAQDVYWPIIYGINTPSFPVGMTQPYKQYWWFRYNKETRKMAVWSLPQCAQACAEWPACRYFTMFGCGYFYAGGLNCLLADGTAKPVDQGVKYCATSAMIVRSTSSPAGPTPPLYVRPSPPPTS